MLEVSSPAAERGRKPETLKAGEHYDKGNTLQDAAALHRNSLILCHSDEDLPGHHLRGDRTGDVRDIVNAWRPSQTKLKEGSAPGAMRSANLPTETQNSRPCVTPGLGRSALVCWVEISMIQLKAPGAAEKHRETVLTISA